MISHELFCQRLDRIFSQDSDLKGLTFEDILNAIPTVDQLSDLPRGSLVLIRADLDAPVKNGKVVDPARMQATAKTVNYCIRRGLRVVLFGHIGRDNTCSLEPVRQAMSEEIGQPITFVSKWLDESETHLLDEAVSRLRTADSIIMLENTRIYDIETALWNTKAAELPEVCDRMYSLAQDFRDRLTNIEINEAMAASNFDFSSSVLPLVMSTTALGFHISEEMKIHVRDARNANMVVISGLKIDKLDALEGIVKRGRVKWLLVAGSLAMAIKKAKAQMAGNDFCIGRAETDQTAKFYISPERINQGKQIIDRCQQLGVDVVLPVDFVLDTGEVVEEIPPDRVQFDIGPKSIELISHTISEYISAHSKSEEPFRMFYNGVFGKFEDPKYESGTREFISHLSRMTQSGVRTYVGGGEGRLALLKYGAISDVTHAFTAGGTILKCLADKHIHFLKAMYLQNTEHSRELVS